MSNRLEVVVKSCGTDSNASVQFLDPTSGTILQNIKIAKEIESNCLSFVGNDYIIYSDKSIIHAKMVSGGNSSQRKAHGLVSALAVSPNSRYCVYAVANNIKVLSLQSGKLTHVKTKHFNTIKLVKFTDDGSCFVTAGLDGLIIVWNLGYILSCEIYENNISTHREPVYVFTSHSLPITDLCVGHGGMQAFIVSVSGDQTCNIHSLADGHLILSLVFKCALTAVTMSVNETELFIGTVKGNIHKCNLSRMPRTRDYHMNEVDLAFVYAGHKSAINCLSTSLDGLQLLSGCRDGIIVLWDIVSGQSVKVFKHKGPVFNAFFAICPHNLFLGSFEPSTVVLLENNSQPSGITKFYRKSGFRSLSNEDKRLVPDFSQKLNVEEEINRSQSNSNSVLESSKLRIINKQIFDFTTQRVLQDLKYKIGDLLNEEDLNEHEDRKKETDKTNEKI